MTQDQGASARADRATRASPEPASGLGQKASVPCAFTVADVLAWARTKPADEEYDYCGFETPCAVAQFLMETGRSGNPQVGGNCYDEGAPWDDNDGKRHFIAPEIAWAANDARGQTTFGAFVRRLTQIGEQVSA